MYSSSVLLQAFFWIVVILVITSLTLFTMGRTPWYRYGPPSLWSRDTTSSQNSQQLADPYTFTHILHGIGLYFILWLIARKASLPTRLTLSVLIESCWEILENTPFIIERYRSVTISRDYYGDSILNSLGDIGTSILGFLLAALLPIWGTVVVILLIELFLLWWIRDSLLLNIIMILYPLESIKQWQNHG